MASTSLRPGPKYYFRRALTALFGFPILAALLLALVAIFWPSTTLLVLLPILVVGIGGCCYGFLYFNGKANDAASLRSDQWLETLEPFIDGARGHAQKLDGLVITITDPIESDGHVHVSYQEVETHWWVHNPEQRQLLALMPAGASFRVKFKERRNRYFRGRDPNEWAWASADLQLDFLTFERV